MEIQKFPIDQFQPAGFNPRVTLLPGDEDYEDIKASLVEFGPVEPLIVNKRSGLLISGHQRWRILKELGYQEIEAVVVDLPPNKEQVLNLIMNKVRGRWDELKLAELFAELGKEPAIDMELTGFDLPEISAILDRQRESQEDSFDVEAALEVIETPITRPGDLIELGCHRVLCGDATNADHLQRLGANQKVDLLDCDWPYNVNYLGGSSPRTDTRPKKSRKWDAIYSDNMPQPEYEAFMRKVLANVKQHLKPGAAFYQWQAHRQLGPLYQILVELDFHVACLICWAKESAAISFADYSFQTEQAVYGWLKGASHYFAGSPGESNLWQVKRDPTKSYRHPCQKPVALAERAIKNSSRRGDIVLDVFLGSGSVLIGAERLGRRCFGTELDPRYCDVTIKRWIALVGRDKVSDEIRQRYVKEASNV